MASRMLPSISPDDVGDGGRPRWRIVHSGEFANRVGYGACMSENHGFLTHSPTVIPHAHVPRHPTAVAAYSFVRRVIAPPPRPSHLNLRAASAVRRSSYRGHRCCRSRRTNSRRQRSMRRQRSHPPYITFTPYPPSPTSNMLSVPGGSRLLAPGSVPPWRPAPPGKSEGVPLGPGNLQMSRPQAAMAATGPQRSVPRDPPRTNG